MLTFIVILVLCITVYIKRKKIEVWVETKLKPEINRAKQSIRRWVRDNVK